MVVIWFFSFGLLTISFFLASVDKVVNHALALEKEDGFAIEGEETVFASLETLLQGILKFDFCLGWNFCVALSKQKNSLLWDQRLLNGLNYIISFVVCLFVLFFFTQTFLDLESIGAETDLNVEEFSSENATKDMLDIIDAIDENVEEEEEEEEKYFFFLVFHFTFF